MVNILPALLLAAILVPLVIFALTAFLHPVQFRIGVRNARRDRIQAVSAITGAIVGTAAITGALLIGDSMDELVKGQIEDNLGELDVAAVSHGFFPDHLYDSVEWYAGAKGKGEADHSAPLISLSAAAFSDAAGRSQLDSRLLGYDTRYFTFGHMYLEGGALSEGIADEALKGDQVQGPPQAGYALIDRAMADELDAGTGDTVRVLAGRPAFDISSVFSLDDDGRVEMEFIVAGVVADRELGRYQLDGRSDITPTIFVGMRPLQELLEVGDRINTMLFSAQGDVWEGADNSAELADTLEDGLDMAVGVDESGFAVEVVDPEEWEYRWTGSGDYPYGEPDMSGVTPHAMVTAKDYFFRSGDVTGPLEEEGATVSPALTYLVNAISTYDGSAQVAYSTVTGLDPATDAPFGDLVSAGSGEVVDGPLTGDDIILNEWTADHLAVGEGDRVILNYTIIDLSYRETEYGAAFTVRDVAAMEGRALDRSLMPHLPGIEGIDDCARFDPPFDVDLSIVTDADERYWDLYQGAPKAFISLERARQMWSNIEGDTTSVRVLVDAGGGGGSSGLDDLIDDVVGGPGGTGGLPGGLPGGAAAGAAGVPADLPVGTRSPAAPSTIAARTSAWLNDSLGASDASITVVDLKGEALDASDALEIFPQMFATFGGVIIVVGMLFTITAMGNLAVARRRETGVMRALGMRTGQVGAAFFSEGAAYSLIGAMVGPFIGLLVGWSLVGGLNGAFQGAVEGQAIHFIYSPASLVAGFLAGFIIAIVAVAASASMVSKGNVREALEGGWRLGKPRGTLRRQARLSCFSRDEVGEQPDGLGPGNPVFKWPALVGIVLGVFFILFAPLVEAGILPSYKTMGIPEPGTLLVLWGVTFLIVAGFMTAEWKCGRLPSVVRAMAGVTAGLWVLAFAVTPVLGGRSPLVALYVSAGLLWLFAIIGTLLLRRDDASRDISRSRMGAWKGMLPARIAMLNPGRRPWRSFTTSLSFGFVIFLMISLSISGAVIETEANRTGHMGGGYDLLGETAFAFDGDPDDIEVEGVDGLEVTAIKSVGDEGGTCSNMNARFPPRLLGVGPDFRDENKVQVQQARDGGATDRDIWRELFDTRDAVAAEGVDGAGGAAGTDSTATVAGAPAANLPDDNIPIAVDLNTLVWIYGGLLGSVFEITDERGTTRTLEVTAVLENSIFAGTFVMAREYLELMFPQGAQLRFFLLRTTTDPQKAAPLVEEALADYGMDVTPIEDLVKANLAYERSFMDLFSMYLGFGLVLGGVGLCIAMDRAVTERRHELGVLRSLGFTRGMIMGEVILEAGALVGMGVVTGSVVAIMGSLLTIGIWGPVGAVGAVPWAARGVYVAALYGLGILAVMPAAWKASRMSPAAAIRTGE